MSLDPVAPVSTQAPAGECEFGGRSSSSTEDNWYSKGLIKSIQSSLPRSHTASRVCSARLEAPRLCRSVYPHSPVLVLSVQCSAVQCSVVQCSVVHCMTVHCIALHCRAGQWVDWLDTGRSSQPSCGPAHCTALQSSSICLTKFLIRPLVLPWHEKSDP